MPKFLAYPKNWGAENNVATAHKSISNNPPSQPKSKVIKSWLSKLMMRCSDTIMMQSIHQKFWFIDLGTTLKLPLVPACLNPK